MYRNATQLSIATVVALALSYGAIARAQVSRLPAYDLSAASPPGSSVQSRVNQAMYGEPVNPVLREVDSVPIHQYMHSKAKSFAAANDFSWQLLPDSIIYKSYLAGVKEPRMAGLVYAIDNDSTYWEGDLGARVGLIRYGTRDDLFPQGFQLDAEGAAQVRLNIPEDVDVTAVDFRAGLVGTWGYGRWQTKFGYYHISSHLGDEFLIKNWPYPRVNYAKDALLLGQSYYITEDLRVYAEAAWGFATQVAEPWEFQFGAEWAPARPTGFYGAPFLAVNGYLREEVNFGGNFVVQTGWSWRSDEGARLLRIGLHYFNGESSEFSFYDDFEHQLGVGVWYDF